MHLSETEEKMIEKLRRKEEARRRWRWWMLLVGVFGVGTSGYSFTLLLPLFRAPDLAAVFLVACFLPQLYLGWLFSFGLIGFTWANWNGHPQTRLLLRLIDEKRES